MRRKDNKFRSNSKIGKCFDEVVRLYRSGLSLRELEKIFQIDSTNIYRSLKSRGIEIRGQKQGIRLCIDRGRWPILSGSRNPGWRGGRARHSLGYILIHNPNHLRADNRGYVPEQILVAEKALGRLLVKQEVVHHINRIRDDNRPENLQVMTLKEHYKLHGMEWVKKGWEITHKRQKINQQ